MRISSHCVIKRVQQRINTKVGIRMKMPKEDNDMFEEAGHFNFVRSESSSFLPSRNIGRYPGTEEVLTIVYLQTNS